MDRPKQCPFCKGLVWFTDFVFEDFDCPCGAKYHWQSNTWTYYDKAKKERTEIRGDLWNENR